MRQRPCNPSQVAASPSSSFADTRERERYQCHAEESMIQPQGRERASKLGGTIYRRAQLGTHPGHPSRSKPIDIPHMLGVRGDEQAWREHLYRWVYRKGNVTQWNKTCTRLTV